MSKDEQGYADPFVTTKKHRIEEEAIENSPPFKRTDRTPENQKDITSKYNKSDLTTEAARLRFDEETTTHETDSAKEKTSTQKELDTLRKQVEDLKRQNLDLTHENTLLEEKEKSSQRVQEMMEQRIKDLYQQNKVLRDRNQILSDTIQNLTRTETLQEEILQEPANTSTNEIPLRPTDRSTSSLDQEEIRRDNMKCAMLFYLALIEEPLTKHFSQGDTFTSDELKAIANLTFQLNARTYGPVDDKMSELWGKYSSFRKSKETTSFDYDDNFVSYATMCRNKINNEFPSNTEYNKEEIANWTKTNCPLTQQQPNREATSSTACAITDTQEQGNSKA